MQRIKTQVVRIDKDPSRWNGQIHEIEWAAKLLTEGRIGAFPTETVYGIGALAMDEMAVERIFEVKGRDKRNPLIVHVASIRQAIELTTEFNDTAMTLANEFWPGPLTMVLPKNPCIPGVTTAGLDTVGIRKPDNAIALELIRLAGPIAAPSANASSLPSGTTVRDIRKDLGGKIDFIIDGGSCVGIGLESTIIDLTSKVPTILREGGLPTKEIQALIGDVNLDPSITEGKAGDRPKAPGMMFKHYSPKYAKVIAFMHNGSRLQTLHMMDQRGEEIKNDGKKVVFIFSGQIPSRMRDRMKRFGEVCAFSDAWQLGKHLFKKYRDFDRTGTFILVEEAEDFGIGRAVNNRIRISAGGNIVEPPKY
ncbi:Threonylcarbamoyl-AMP synthase [uncultured archaeon]|nr:Threonylcarbamoyl-AMP synthase [uncultured archaeon]